jgi:hypothetical protein
MKRALLFLTVIACEAPPPECAPRGGTYEICSDDAVWQCPDGPADVIAFNLAQDEACNEEADPVACLLESEYQYVEMTLSADCAAGGQICTEDPMVTPSIAVCEDP